MVTLVRSKISACLDSGSAQKAIVVGVPGATDPHREMLIENKTTQVPTVIFGSDSDGSFIARVGARENDIITVYSYSYCQCTLGESVTLVVEENCE